MSDEGLRPLSDSQRELLEEAASSYEAELQFSTEGMAYLTGRGITEESISKFRLGIVGDPLPGHERYRGWLAIPYLVGADGHVAQIRFRCIQDHDHRANGHGKYGQVTGDPSRVFNVSALLNAQEMVACGEGEMDGIILNQIGIPAIALPGVSNWGGRHFHLLSGFSRVWVFADPDDAGMELANKMMRSLRSARAVRLRDGDVTDTFTRYGADALYELIGGKP